MSNTSTKYIRRPSTCSSNKEFFRSWLWTLKTPHRKEKHQSGSSIPFSGQANNFCPSRLLIRDSSIQHDSAIWYEFCFVSAWMKFSCDPQPADSKLFSCLKLGRSFLFPISEKQYIDHPHTKNQFWSSDELCRSGSLW